MADRAALQADLLDFVARPSAGDFDALALRVVAHQAAVVAPYGRLVAATGGLPATWRHAPLVPTDLFKELDLCSAAPTAAVAATFLTSGTTVGIRGRRRVPDLALYHAGMVAPFVEHVLAGDAATRRPWLALIPQAADSSLAHMVAGLASDLASEITWAFDESTLAWAKLRAASQPVVVLATAFALVHLLDRSAADLNLPEGSRLMLTGGFKGKTREVSEAELLAAIEARLGLPGAAVVPEYGMTELTSQAYGRPFVAPPWLRLRVVDPVTLTDVAPATEGLVAFFDLLNLDNVSAILTGDLGRLDARGRLTLLGRAPGATLRGCSLTAEELLGG